MAMNMNLLLKHEIRVLRAENEQKMKKKARGVLISVMKFFCLYKKVKTAFSSLIYREMSRFLSCTYASPASSTTL
jgi:hypothetical protein